MDVGIRRRFAIVNEVRLKPDPTYEASIGLPAKAGSH
jgi:hypothetical protein